ncbi:hypothetical protein F5B20DRAFT_578445 [Whalleya microplaca]|nr:hypothetical protein F5B20DRAFT_578445 [Whalleya microplaca]
MTRPKIIRADSIDLQDHDAPSAKEHKRPSAKSAPNGFLAPHQAETIREVEEDRAGEEGRSPRISWAEGDTGGDLQQYAEDLATSVADSLNGNTMQSQDALAIAQNGGTTGNNSDDGDLDADADDGLDDDMMDKISSSPSIEDGGCTLPPAWPARVDSLRSSVLHCDSPSSSPISEARSSSPYLDPAEHLPLQPSDWPASKAPADTSDRHHLLPGEYTGLAKNIYETADFDDRLLLEPQPNIIHIKVEDFSLDQSPGTQLAQAELDQDEANDEDIISPYEFLIPYEASDEEEDDDDYDLSLTADHRFVDYGWGSECLQDSEDIDFEFVYALHTFVATVEGQANATKGDTMVLLDDSNSYWWLVRVVKDSSIGYLPAEHIETPTERLARLNKHRNIDLSATMLGDQAEKVKNPIKTVMKRKKKNVTFTAPTYVDYSDFEYSSAEEDGEGEIEGQQQGAQEQAQQQQQTSMEIIEDDESAKVEPLKPRSQQKQVKIESGKPEELERADSAIQDDTRRSSDEMFDGKSERTTRNGTVRNTDSFFKDETIETKKITLTPGLLRDDNEPRGSSDSKEFQLRQRPSFDKMEKELTPDKKDDKKKKDKEKKEKEKKPSAIRSFFSRNNKKKSVDEDDDSIGKRSMDAEVTEKEIEEAQAADLNSSPEAPGTPQRNPSKLQKQHPRNEASPARKPGSVIPQTSTERGPLFASEVKTNNVANVPPTTLRMVESDLSESQDRPSQKDEKSIGKSAISKMLTTNTEPREPKPPKVTKAKSRVELDDFDSPEEEEDTPEPARTTPEPTRAPPEPKRQLSEEKLVRPTLPGAYPDSYLGTSTPTAQQTEQTQNPQRSTAERLSESPVQVSPVASSNPPALMVDTSSQEDRSSPISSPSPELGDVDSQTHRNQDSMGTSTSATSASTWNDANLRLFFDSSSDIRDLLVIVNDTTDVAPAGPDHPIAGSLFREQNARLAEITTQLDNMLGDWLARKQRLRGTV